mmetsp:Transcript_96848/g.141669  ORF Transcript_96848/g.141669 Transcript_96848/m.141669 type:complete len:135 (-) Transcript_96848:212-616(-)
MFEVIHHFSQLSSCVGTNSCGVGAPVQFGATTIDSTHASENFLSDSNSTTSYAMTGSNQGMFNDYASVNAFWSDTTLMDNLRAADITDSTVAGSLETIGANTDTTNVRGGHSVHTASSNSVMGLVNNSDVAVVG